MERAQVEAWLGDYIEAWRSNERERIAALFTDDARYRYYPQEEAIVGGEAIAQSWLDDPDEPGSWTASYEPVAVDGDTAVATGESVYTDPDGSLRGAYDNCFVIRFADDGRCREFVEYYVKRPQTADA